MAALVRTARRAPTEARRAAPGQLRRGAAGGARAARRGARAGPAGSGREAVPSLQGAAAGPARSVERPAGDRVLAPSAATAAELERDYGARDVAVLPNVTGGLPAAAERCPGPGDERDFLLFVGRLRIRKGVEVLLEALAAGGEDRLWIAGDGEHRARLEARADELGLRASGRVRFLGRASRGEVRDLLSRARALVVPSTYEGMPLVVLEAMEAGVPVVASRVSGIPEVVIDGETGWLVPCEDPRRGAAGRQRVELLYRPAVAAATWERLVEEKGES
ncbi:MAG: glycosyltransferase [Thermoanaerobaculia bacterium]|nr:MAG: glycosyltransferase [Thermoanaerobaculia bacterium]